MRVTKRILFTVLVVTMALAVGTVSAQQKGRRGGGGFFGGGGNNLVTLAAVEAVQKDLGVSSDVAGKGNANARQSRSYLRLPTFWLMVLL